MNERNVTPRPPNKSIQKHKLFFLEDIIKATFFFFLSILNFWVGLRTPSYIDLDGLGTAVTFLLGIFCFYLGSRHLKSAYFRLKGKLVERLYYWRLKFWSCYVYRMFNVYRNVFPTAVSSDIDILLVKIAEPSVKITVEVKTAQSDWGLSSMFSFSWSSKAKNAIRQAKATANSANANLAVLWLPLCTNRVCCFRDGVLVVSGGPRKLVKAIKKNI